MIEAVVFSKRLTGSTTLEQGGHQGYKANLVISE